MDKEIPEWKQFEIAVKNFMEALGVDAQITHDAKLPDVHTGKIRQRDVWIEWKIGNHFPVKALISCKFYNKTLDQQDLDHFNGEFISSGAQIGIIYSKSGFNKNALQKAKVLNFHCCKLYRGEAPEIPEVLILGLAFLIKTKLRFALTGEMEELNTWKEVLDYKNSHIRELVIKEITEYQSLNKDRWERVRDGKSTLLEINDKLKLIVELKDVVYIAKLSSYELKGSYNFSDSSFQGTQSTPSVDTQSDHPGEGWELVQDLPEEQPKTFWYMQLIPDKLLTSFENDKIRE